MKQTSSYSKFTDRTEKTFDEIIEKLDSKIGSNSVEQQGEELKTSFDVFAPKSNIVISGNTYNYKVYKYFSESLNVGFEDDSNRELRVSTTEALLIIFSNGETNQYVIDKSNSDSKGKSIIRKLMDYEEIKQIEINQISLLSNKDFYLWLFYIVLNNMDVDDKLTVQSIEAYKGNTYIDKLTNVSGSGRQVMNLLSTLTFLFEIEEISKVKLKINFENHKFVVEFIDNVSTNNLKIYLNNYEGNYDELDLGHFIAHVVMRIILEVLPYLSSIYTNYEWDKEEFKEQIGKEVITRINSKLINSDSQNDN